MALNCNGSCGKDLEAEIQAVLNQVEEHDDRIMQRNQKRTLLIEQLSDLLPDVQFHRFEKIINETIDAAKTSPDSANLKPIVLDEEDPVQSLRQLRSDLSQEICKAMGVDTSLL